MDFFKFSIYSIICLIFIHFIFYFHNVDIIECLYGSSNDTLHNVMTTTTDSQNAENVNEPKRSENESNQTHTEVKNDILESQNDENINKGKINRENHIKELLQGLEELQDK